MSDEAVLVLPAALVTSQLGGGESWYGLREGGEGVLAALLRRAGTFRPRSAMESDPTWKQVIPYTILRDGEDWFLMRRTRAGGDARLHGRCSIGVGGHVNPVDGAIDGDLAAALRREWLEELDVDFVPSFRFVGLLNDDTTPVGAVHLGVVMIGDAGGRGVAIRETDKLSGAFVATAAVAAVRDQLESWSRIVFDALAPQAVAT